MFSRLHIINSRKYLLLFAVFIISLSLRFWILDKRWINPDEGAHLMDAVLVLDGMIPSIDFHSRQPLYVYAKAATLKLFGTHYVSGRILPLMCSILVGWLVFLMAHMLFDEKVGFLSATLYWILPLEVINSPIVKTEPLVILFTCVSICALVSFSQSNRPGWLVVSGIFAAMGFYVRQSALIIPITVFGFLVLFYGRQIREIVRNFGYFLVGYTVVLVFAVLYFGRFMRMDEFLMSGLNPLGFLVPQGKKLLSITGLSIENANGSSSHVGSLHYDKYPLYLKYVGQVFRLHSFLVIGLAFSLFIFCRHILTRSTDQAKEHIMSHAILYLWLFSLLLAYVYFYYAQGFYIDYFREFLPPLVIIFSAWLRSFLPSFDREGVLEWFIIIGLCTSAIFFFAESSLQWSLGAGSYACLSIAILALLYFAKAYESSARQIVFMFVLSFVIVIILAFQLAPLNPFFSGIVPKLTVAGIIVVIP